MRFDPAAALARRIACVGEVDEDGHRAKTAVRTTSGKRSCFGSNRELNIFRIHRICKSRLSRRRSLVAASTSAFRSKRNWTVYKAAGANRE